MFLSRLLSSQEICLRLFGGEEAHGRVEQMNRVIVFGLGDYLNEEPCLAVKKVKKYMFLFDQEFLKLARLELDVWPSWSNRDVNKKKDSAFERLATTDACCFGWFEVITPLILARHHTRYSPEDHTWHALSPHLCNIHERHGDRLTLRFALSRV